MKAKLMNSSVCGVTFLQLCCGSHIPAEKGTTQQMELGKSHDFCFLKVYLAARIPRSGFQLGKLSCKGYW
jgi:hypothetical protein